MKSNTPQHIRELLKRALSRMDSGDLDEAESLLAEAQQHDEENPEIWYNLAVIKMKKSSFAEAASLLEKILKSPLQTVDIIQTKLMLSFAYLSLQQYKSCAPLLIAILNAVPGNITALSLLGYYYEKISNPDKAVETYQKILSYDKDNPNARNSFAYLSALAGKDLNKALASARICVKKEPDNPAYYDTLGYIYMKMGHTDMARKYLKAAQQRMPDSTLIRDHLHELLKI